MLSLKSILTILAKLILLGIEVIYKALKNEIDKSVASVKRGDTSISYVVESKDIQSLMKNYSSAIKRILGCDSGVFFY